MQVFAYELVSNQLFRLELNTLEKAISDAEQEDLA